MKRKSAKKNRMRSICNNKKRQNPRRTPHTPISVDRRFILVSGGAENKEVIFQNGWRITPAFKRGWVSMVRRVKRDDNYYKSWQTTTPLIDFQDWIAGWDAASAGLKLKHST